MAKAKQSKPNEQQADPRGARKVREQLLQEIDTDDTEAALEWLKSRWKIWAALAALSLVVIVALSLNDDQAREKFGSIDIKLPYLRTTKAPV